MSSPSRTGGAPGSDDGALAQMQAEAASEARFRAEIRSPAVWRPEVLARVRRIASIPMEDGGAQVSDLTAVARDAAMRPASPRRWWYGTLIERAWLALHEAEAEAVSRMTPYEAMLWWQRATGIRPRAESAEGDSVFPPDAAIAAASLRVHYDQSDRLFEETRALRNRLICLTATGLTITGLLLGVGASGVLRINSGASSAVKGPGQFLVVALFGAIGAFISGLPALSRRPRRLSSYWTAPYQMSLKLSVGPVFALLGILILEARFLDQARPFGGFGGAVLLWAVIFGSAQQLVTRILDRKASSLAAESADSADPRQAPHENDHTDAAAQSRIY